MDVNCTREIQAQEGGRDFELTFKRAEPLGLHKIDLVGPHVLPNRGFRVGLRLLLVRIQERVEPRHAPLPGDPAYAALALVLERDDLIRAGEIRVDEGVQDGPYHLGLGAREADAHQVPHRRAGAVRTDEVLGPDHRVVLMVGCHGDGSGVLRDGDTAGVEQHLGVLHPRGES